MNKEEYIRKMTPYAQRVSSALNIPYEVILTQWVHETGYGTSALVQRGSNNHAGIKSSSKGKDFVSGVYSGYNSLNNFVNDYVRVMNLSYYNKVRSVGASGDINKTIDALHESPWAEDPKYDEKMKRVFNSLDFGLGELTSGGVNIGELQKDLSSMSDNEVKQMALVGLGVVTLLALVKK